jgi:hypothetical protein
MNLLLKKIKLTDNTKLNQYCMQDLGDLPQFAAP